MADNAASLAVDWSTTQQINLARVEAGSVAKVTAILKELEAETIKILDQNKSSVNKQAKLEIIRDEAHAAIEKSYAKIKVTHGADLQGVAKAAGKGAAKQINYQIGVNVADPVLTDKQLEKLASDTLVFGAKSNDWWQGQEAGLKDKFLKQMRMGYGLGESVEELSRRVRGTKANGFNDGIMSTSRREAEALVRSSIQTISNQARIDQFTGMQPLVKGVQWIATLDGRTTLTCMGLDKMQWRLPDYEPIGHSKKFPGPTGHWGCRSTQIAVTRSWEELSGMKIPALDDQTLQKAVELRLGKAGMPAEQIAKVKVRARASMDGQVAQGADFETWLKGKPPEFVNDVLGPSRAALWQEGKLTLKDLTDQTGRPLTVKALEAAIDGETLPDETEGVDFTPYIAEALAIGAVEPEYVLTPLSKAETQAYNDEATAKMADILANPKGQTLKAKAIQQLQKTEPDLPPVLMLAKAETIAAEKQAAASKASVLSTAKKKILAGEEPTPAQKAVIDALSDEEKANWDSAINDAKGMANNGKVDQMIADVEAAYLNGENPSGKISQTEYEALNSDQALKYDQAVVKFTTKAKIDSFSNQAATGADPDFLIETIGNLTKKANDPDIAKHAEAAILKIQDQQVVNDIDELQLTPEGMAAIDAAKAKLPKGATAIDMLKQAKIELEAIEKQADADATSSMLYLAKNPEGQTLKAKALANHLGVPAIKLDGMGAEGLKKAIAAKGLPPKEVLAKIEAEAAEKQAAASKASKLSTAKKKLLEGKQPSPSEQATIDSLTPEELTNWQSSLQDGKAVKEGIANGGSVTITPATPPAPITTKQTKAGKVTLTAAPTFLPTEAPKLVVPPLADLVKIKELSGSTKPWLAEDPTTGAKFVIKSTTKGLKESHLKSEAVADAIYRAAGVDVPASTQPDSKTKVSAFLDDAQTLGSWMAGKSESDPEVIRINKELRKGFVTDALLANWDVAGLSKDNILVTKDGKPIRIDNGGSMGFRAQGGKKESFYDSTGEIHELESLLNSGSNPQTASIFKGITKQEIEEQSRTILQRRKDIIEAAKASGIDKKDLAALERRMDWLEAKTPMGAQQTPEAEKATRAAISSLSPELPRLAAKAKINGLSLDMGTRHVEDAQALVWKENDASGNPVTVVQLKVTDDGAKAVRTKMAGEFAQAKQVNPSAVQNGQHPGDKFHTVMVNAAKTLKHHADDKAFNASTMQALHNLGGDLANMAKSKDPAEQEMASHYQALWDKLMDVDKTASKTALINQVPTVSNWTYDPKKYEKTKAKKVSSDRVIEKITEYHARANDFKQGEATNTSGAAMKFTLDNGGYRVKTNDGVVVEYIDRAGSYSERQGLALEGTTTVRIPGDITPAKMARALQELADIGIDIEPPNDDYKEYLLIRRTAALTKHVDKESWAKVDAIQDDAQRAALARKWAKANYNVKLPDRNDPKWQEAINGNPNHDGSGWRRWDRVDLKDSDRKKLNDFVLIHRTGADIATAIEGMLNSGGEATATIGRVRKGVEVNAGMSSHADVRTGGASYFFTRIRKKGSSEANGAGLVFKGELLNRADAVSYTGDRFGRISALKDRKHTVADYASMSGSDETIFKNALDLARDIQQINSGSAAKRAKIIKAFKDHGYAILPDGRAIEDVVK